MSYANMMTLLFETHDRQSMVINLFKSYDMVLWKLYLHFSCSGFLYQVYLGTGYCAGGDESAVLGADEIQIAFGGIGAVFGGFQFSLETAHAGYTLAGNSLLQKIIILI